MDSRVKSGQLIVKALKELPNKVQAVVSASAIGWYGADPQISTPVPFTEAEPPSQFFLSRVCKQWEEAIQPVTELQKRLVIFRIGIVLSNEGGAYPEFKKSLKFRVAAILGSGKQIVSWIHVDDLVRLFIEALENENWKGVYNAVAPNPVSNSQLTQSIGAAAGKTYICIHVPQFVLKAMLGEMSIEVLKSATVSSKKIERTGFQFLYNDIDSATHHLNQKQEAG